MSKRWSGSSGHGIMKVQTQTFVRFFSPMTSAKKQNAHELKTVHQPKSVRNDVNFLSVNLLILMDLLRMSCVSCSAEANLPSKRRVQELWDSVWANLCQTKPSDLHTTVYFERLPMQERICQSSKWRLCGAESLSERWENENSRSDLVLPC